MLAWPAAFRLTVFWATPAGAAPFSVKVTVPAVTGRGGLPVVTVAVKVTGLPESAGSSDEITCVEVGVPPASVKPRHQPPLTLIGPPFPFANSAQFPSPLRPPNSPVRVAEPSVAACRMVAGTWGATSAGAGKKTSSPVM